MATSNPAFSRDFFPGYEQVYGAAPSTTMTVQGAMVKTFVLLAIVMGTALFSWNAMAGQSLAPGLVFACAIGGFVVAMITTFKPTIAPWSAPLYAALEGVFLGAVSQVIETQLGPESKYSGIAMQAVTLTCGVTFIMLFAYASRLIRVTDKLRMGIVAATGALCLFYLVSFVLSFFGMGIPLIFSATPIGIGFSIFVVGLAAFNLLLDFDFIEKSAYSECAQVHGVVRRVRVDGHIDLALSRDPAVADEAGEPA